MSKITVYLPEDLAARVKEYRDQLNVSQIARAAIARALADLSAKERPPMSLQATIDRLTAEKLEHRQEPWEHESQELGRSWATKEASVEQLKRLPEIDDPILSEGEHDLLYHSWYARVFGEADIDSARDFWHEWLLELQARGFSVEEVSVCDFNVGACEIYDRLRNEKPDLFD